MRNKIAILLATFNGEKYIADQLQSIIYQTHSDWHLFIRDDGSTDDTLNILNDYESRFENISIVKNLGEYTGSAAGNFFKLIQMCDFEGFDYIGLSDQDDLWSPDKLEKSLELLVLNSASGYSSNLISYDNTKKCASYIDKSQPQKSYDYIFQGASAGCTYVFTREVCLLIQRSTSSIESFKGRSHDWLIYAICRVNEIPWVFDDKAYIFYRQHSNNVWGAKSAISGLINKLKILKSGWYRDNVKWIAINSNCTSQNPTLIERIHRLSFQDRLYLCKMARQFRREKKESILLAFILVFLF